MSGYPQSHEGKLGIGLVTGQFYPHSFTLADLDDFEDFVAQHERCIWYSDVAQEGLVDTNAVAIRHDVDHSIVHAHRFAKWEEDHGINSTYFILPTAAYWAKEDMFGLALEMQAMGHEIGVHNDAHCAAKRYVISKGCEEAYNAQELAALAIEMLWKWTLMLREAGLNITGCADHGGGEPQNVDLWKEPFNHTPEDADLRYEAYELHHRGANYISDNRGVWRSPLKKINGKQSHVLLHPEHFLLS